MAISKAGINSQSGNRLDNLSAADSSYDNSTSGLTAAQVQAAIDELKALIDNAGGGALFTKSYTGVMTMALSGTGTLLTIPAPVADDERIAITTLQSSAANANITLSGSVHGIRVNDKTLNFAPMTTGEFAVGSIASTTNFSHSGAIHEVVFDIGETVTLSKTGAVASGTLYYAYSIMKG